MTEEEQLFSLQQLQDKYGYVILGNPCDRPYKIGEVVHGVTLNATGENYHRDDIVTTVVGFATMEEWRAQCLEAYGLFDDERAKEFRGSCIRVRAE